MPMNNILALWLVVACALGGGWIVHSSHGWYLVTSGKRSRDGPIDLYSVMGGIAGATLGAVLAKYFLL